jgi:methionine-rich copper-binding protein CopC
MLLGFGLLAFAGCAPVRAAAPKLVAAWPSGTAPLPLAPRTFELTFNRALNADDSWAALWRYADGEAVSGESTLSQHVLQLRVDKPDAGEYRLHWHAVGALSGLAADGEQLLVFQDESPRPARLDASRSALDSGETLELRGSGFAPSSLVRVTIGDDQQDMKAIQTDARGGFQDDARVPSSVPFGMQPISAVDQDGVEAATALQVRWGGWPPLMAFTTGAPGPAPGEVTFTVSVRNRSDFLLEKVRVLLPDPEGAGFVAAEPAAQRTNGTLAWDIGSMDRGVVGPLRVSYRVTGPVAAHARIAFRHRRPARCEGDECLSAFVSETTSDSTVINPPD